eukprot:9501175-Pyramimonas_sp.AAC.1
MEHDPCGGYNEINGCPHAGAHTGATGPGLSSLWLAICVMGMWTRVREHQQQHLLGAAVSFFPATKPQTPGA